MTASKFARAMSAFVAAAMVMPALPVLAAGADDLRDVVGAKGRDGEPTLEQRGYTHIDTGKSSTAAYSYWWNNKQKACIRVTTRDGRYAEIVNADESDCGQTHKETGKDAGMSDGAKVAIGAAAILGIAALAHKSHHRDDRNYNEEETADFERGYRDGLYNNSYHNYGDNRNYSDGYNRGVDERRNQSSYRYGNGNANYGSEWVSCAKEGDFCNFRGPGQVRFGIDGRYVTRRGFNGMSCTEGAFGDDPAYGKRKQCYVRQGGR
jgi:hypothetical protein